MSTKTIKVEYLARVEGEGALYLTHHDGKVSDVQLKIFEPPRFFEALLRGRHFSEAPDITARICGICPVAYQMSAVHAMEAAAGVRIGGALRELRRLLYCGEWIESHGLHMVMLHAPDFLGYPSAVAMAKDHGERVKAGLFIKKMGNTLVALLGGREIHPINVRLGGFYKIPPLTAFQALLADLEKARAQTIALLEWFATFTYPDYEFDYELVALQHASEYPLCEGRIISTRGLAVDAQDFETVMEEHHVPYTNALQATMKGRGAYLCGPLARFALNYEQLPALCREQARQLGIDGGTRNPYKSLMVRGIEVLFAFSEAIRIISTLAIPSQPYIPVPAHEGIGCAATEAPRGLLYHRYGIAGNGEITSARIIPPTSQNQLSIEDDLRRTVPLRAHEPEEELQKFCEQTIRNYDPCISCATHFLKIHTVKAGSP